MMMQKGFILLALSCQLAIVGLAQEKLEIGGAIVIENSEDVNPTTGTIRFNTSTKDFEGWNGSHWLSLTRLTQIGDGVSDLQGNFYGTAKIGTQEWMTKNLVVTKYNDGSNIPLAFDNTEWGNLATGAWCWYNNDAANQAVYGKLYNWYVVDTATNGNRNVCPDGWHVPSISDWDVLIENLGGIHAGGKMKEVGLSHWDAPNAGATNESGFNAVPGGSRDNDGDFSGFGQSSAWWTTTPNNIAFVGGAIKYLVHLAGSPDEALASAKTGQSIRCVKDDSN